MLSMHFLWLLPCLFASLSPSKDDTRRLLDIVSTDFSCKSVECENVARVIKHLGIEEATEDLHTKQETLSELLWSETNLALEAWMFPWLQPKLFSDRRTHVRACLFKKVYERTDDLELIRLVYKDFEARACLPWIPDSDLDEIASNLFFVKAKGLKNPFEMNPIEMGQFIYLPPVQNDRRLFDRVNRKTVMAISAHTPVNVESPSRRNASIFIVALLHDYIIPELAGTLIADEEDAKAVMMIMKAQAREFSRYFLHYFHAVYHIYSFSHYQNRVHETFFRDLNLRDHFKSLIWGCKGYRKLAGGYRKDPELTERTMASTLRCVRQAFVPKSMEPDYFIQRFVTDTSGGSMLCKAISRGRNVFLMREAAPTDYLDVFWTSYPLADKLERATIKRDARRLTVDRDPETILRSTWIGETPLEDEPNAADILLNLKRARPDEEEIQGGEGEEPPPKRACIDTDLELSEGELSSFSEDLNEYIVAKTNDQIFEDIAAARRKQVQERMKRAMEDEPREMAPPDMIDLAVTDAPPQSIVPTTLNSGTAPNGMYGFGLSEHQIEQQRAQLVIALLYQQRIVQAHQLLSQLTPQQLAAVQREQMIQHQIMLQHQTMMRQQQMQLQHIPFQQQRLPQYFFQRPLQPQQQTSSSYTSQTNGSG